MSEKFTLKTIVEYTSLFTVSFLLIEGIHQYFYYNLFNFNISSYFTFTFLLNSLLGTISSAITYLLSGVIFFQILALQSGNEIKKAHNERSQIKIDENLSSKEKINLWWKRVTSLELSMIALNISLIILFVRLIITYENFYRIGILCISFFIFIIYSMLYGNQIKDKLRESGNFIAFRIVLLTVCILTSYLVNTYFNFQRLMDNAKNRTTAIEFKDGSETIPAHGQEFYIGRTQEYIFVYNEKDSVTRVINVEDVKRLNVYKGN